MSESMDLDATTEVAWAAFRGRLGDHIAAMDDEDLVVVEYESFDENDGTGSTPYLQLCAFGDNLVQAEAASNHHLDQGCALSVDDEARLSGLGWDAPRDEDGWENYSRTFERRSADEVAVLLVRTLREVYAVPHPAFLAADGLEVDPRAHVPTDPATPGSQSPEAFDEAELEGVPTGPEHLQAMLDAALGEDFADLKHDDDGDIPIVAGSSVVFVRVVQARPCIELYAEIVLDPERLDRLAEELVLLNATHPLWKFASRDGHVAMTHEMLALPFSSLAVRTLVQRFVDDVDQIASDLVVRVGGRRFIEPVPVEDERDVLLSGLIELLHLDRVRPSTVAGLFGHDRLKIIRQIVRIRSGQQSCGDLAEELVLTALRKALRLVSDGEQPARSLPQKPCRRSIQEPLVDELSGLDSEDALDLGWSA